MEWICGKVKQKKNSINHMKEKKKIRQNTLNLSKKKKKTTSITRAVDAMNRNRTQKTYETVWDAISCPSAYKF